MRRLLLLPALAAVFALAPSASADDVDCYGVHAGNVVFGVCAGIICNDICAPRPVVHGQCGGLGGGPLGQLCAKWNDYRPLD